MKLFDKIKQLAANKALTQEIEETVNWGKSLLTSDNTEKEDFIKLANKITAISESVKKVKRREASKKLREAADKINDMIEVIGFANRELRISNFDSLPLALFSDEVDFWARIFGLIK